MWNSPQLHAPFGASSMMAWLGALATLGLVGCGDAALERPTVDSERLPSGLVGDAPTTLDRLVVPSRVVPTSEAIIYTSFVREWTGDGPGERQAELALEAAFEPMAAGSRLTISGHEALAGSVALNADGTIAEHVSGKRVGTDLLDLLPPADAYVALGASYESAAPSWEILRSNHRNGDYTIDVHVVNTPTGMWQLRSGATVLRIETRGFHRIYALPDTYKGDEEMAVPLRTVDMGGAYAGVADLLHHPDHGWRVLRMTRLSAVGEDVDLKTMPLDAIRKLPHHEFTVCAESSTRVDALLRSSGRLVRSNVPELAACDR